MMTTEHHKHAAAAGHAPQHEEVSFEARDVRATPILKFLAYLGVAIVLSYFLTLGVYRGLTRHWKAEYISPPPSRGEAGPTLPPEPRLQGMPGHLSDPQFDWREMLRADIAANNKLGWVDEKSGIAQIPVADAMKLIVERGFPVLPTAAATK